MRYSKLIVRSELFRNMILGWVGVYPINGVLREFGADYTPGGNARSRAIVRRMRELE